jgi:hypothetical protein
MFCTADELQCSGGLFEGETARRRLDVFDTCQDICAHMSPQFFTSGKPSYCIYLLTKAADNDSRDWPGRTVLQTRALAFYFP